ncbi:MAG: sugar ABC transporter permease [Lachnospiraceae bacterium]|nr:sugar ABC transporter permease [Lachnospiraceae bacterium]
MKKRKIKFFTREDKVGFLFVLPFIIGGVFFFLKPMIDSIKYSFHKISFGESGIQLTAVGMENYKTALFGDADFFKSLTTFGWTVALEVVVIMFFSMFVAVLLNQKFLGRLFFRTTMFLPVIFGADVILEYYLLHSADQSSSLKNVESIFGATVIKTPEFLSELIDGFGVLSPAILEVTQYASNIFDLVWEVGLQIVLFTIGLQAIPSYLYEVCVLEGATKWETFWKITFPILSPTILLCLIYTLIDKFNSDNEIMRMIGGNMRTLIHYACAQTWLYTLLILIIVLIVYRIVAKHVVYLD